MEHGQRGAWPEVRRGEGKEGREPENEVPVAAILAEKLL